MQQPKCYEIYNEIENNEDVYYLIMEQQKADGLQRILLFVEVIDNMSHFTLNLNWANAFALGSRSN